jgi:hypothetical protein
MTKEEMMRTTMKIWMKLLRNQRNLLWMRMVGKPCVESNLMALAINCK